jgi:hypothetical protein
MQFKSVTVFILGFLLTTIPFGFVGFILWWLVVGILIAGADGAKGPIYFSNIQSVVGLAVIIMLIFASLSFIVIRTQRSKIVQGALVGLDTVLLVLSLSLARLVIF